jgi:hypothetical protein
MEKRIVGQDQKGTSLAVRQFVAVLRGAVAPHAPNNPFRVEAVRAEERYCLTCCGERWFDVVSAITMVGQGQALSLPIQMARCRCCGAEV